MEGDTELSSELSSLPHHQMCQEQLPSVLVPPE